MPINLTLCTLCDKFNVTGMDSFWRSLFCCFRSKRKEQIDETQDHRIKELEAEIEHLRQMHDPALTRCGEAGATISVYPYLDGSIKTLVDGDNITETDITVLNHALQYIISAGPNLQVFNRDHHEIIGQTAPLPSLPKSIQSFINDMIEATFKGIYVNVVTQWESRLWHFHTHPIYNKPLREGGDIIGIAFITEPYNKPLMNGVDIRAYSSPSRHLVSSPIPVVEQVGQHGEVSQHIVHDKRSPTQSQASPDNEPGG